MDISGWRLSTACRARRVKESLLRPFQKQSFWASSKAMAVGLLFCPLTLALSCRLTRAVLGPPSGLEKIGCLLCPALILGLRQEKPIPREFPSRGNSAPPGITALPQSPIGPPVAEVELRSNGIRLLPSQNPPNPSSQPGPLGDKQPAARWGVWMLL